MWGQYKELFEQMKTNNERVEDKIDKAFATILKVSQDANKELVKIEKKLDRSIAELILSNKNLENQLERKIASNVKAVEDRLTTDIKDVELKIRVELDSLKDQVNHIEDVVTENKKALQEIEKSNVVEIVKDNRVFIETIKQENYLEKFQQHDLAIKAYLKEQESRHNIAEAVKTHNILKFNDFLVTALKTGLIAVLAVTIYKTIRLFYPTEIFIEQEKKEQAMPNKTSLAKEKN